MRVVHAMLLAALAAVVPGPAGAVEARPAPADTLTELMRALGACWEAPRGLEWLERTQITVRVAVKRDGSVLGAPRVTFSEGAPEGRPRAALAEAALDAIRRCTPASITPALGGAVAGRPLVLRFLYRGPTGKGA